MLKKITLFSFFFIFDMPRIPKDLRGRAIGMSNVGMTMDAVVVNTECSTSAIRHLWQRFQTTERTED